MASKEPVAPRRAHRKTRSGCVQCKRRKVKCPEDGCPCKNCIKRGLDCTYANPEPVQGTPGDSSYASHSPQSQQLPVRSEDDFLRTALSRQEELCLVHHYTTSAYVELARDEKVAQVWRNMPFYDGWKYEFVLDAVLAVAALHKAHLEPANGKKYASASLYYQSRTLREYKSQISSIDDDNCHALFAVSSLLPLFTFAMSPGGPGFSPTPPLETLLTTFGLLKGIKVVLAASWDTVKFAHYQNVLSLPQVSPDLPISTEAAFAMDELRRSATHAAETSDAGTLEVYRKTIDSLQEQIRMGEHQDISGAIISWSLMIGDEPAELLQRRDPMMMLIFVHYGVLCLQIHDRWWAHDFGRRLILELSEALHALDAAWFPSTSWARARAARFRNIHPSP